MCCGWSRTMKVSAHRRQEHRNKVTCHGVGLPGLQSAPLHRLGFVEHQEAPDCTAVFGNEDRSDLPELLHGVVVEIVVDVARGCDGDEELQLVLLFWRSTLMLLERRRVRDF